MVNIAVTNCSNQIIHSLLEGACELLGVEDLALILNRPTDGTHLTQQAGGLPVERDGKTAIANYAALPCALEQHYGQPGGQGLALRIGRAAFKYMLLNHGESMGFTSVDYRFQRAPQRILSGLQILADRFSEECGDRISIADAGTHWIWRSEYCPVCRGRENSDVSCYLTIGLIQELLSWAGGSRFYRVVETECHASGAASCTFRIEKKPLD